MISDANQLAVFPDLVARIPKGASRFEYYYARCLFAGYTNVAEETMRPWLANGGLPRSEALPDKLFVAAVRSRQSDELVVLMTDGSRQFSFLERIQTYWTDTQHEAAMALTEAFKRWDSGERVVYVHGFHQSK